MCIYIFAHLHRRILRDVCAEIFIQRNMCLLRIIRLTHIHTVLHIYRYSPTQHAYMFTEQEKIKYCLVLHNRQPHFREDQNRHNFLIAIIIKRKKKRSSRTTKPKCTGPELIRKEPELIGVCATVEQVRSKRLEQGCKMDPRFISSGVGTDNRCMDGCQIYSFHWNISVRNGNWTVSNETKELTGLKFIISQIVR